MIIAEPTSKPIDRIAIAEERKFGIKASAKAFKLLSSTIYPDPIAAPIRELATNAADSHTEAGTTEPFIVHVPNELEPFFYIRDFGTGMSEESVYKIYCNYFESTRTNSNSFTGAFGLGSKTPFCYSDTFTVISYFNGVKYIYTAFLEDGEPRLAKFAEDKTEEKNGVQISFPVKPDDIGRFVSTAKQVYSRFVNKPKIIGCNDFTLETFEYLFSGNDWKIRKNLTRSVLVMGNIGYPLDGYKAGLRDGGLYELSGVGLEISFAIGELQPTVSREEIQYDQETNKKIKEKLQQVKTELSNILKKEVENETNYYNARIKYTDILNSGSHNWQLQSILKAIGFEYGGKKITSSAEEVEPIIRKFFAKQNMVYDRYTQEDSYLGYMNVVGISGKIVKKIKTVPAYLFSYSRTTELFINDETDVEVSNKKLKYHLSKSNTVKNVYVIRNIDDDYRKFLLSELGLELSMFTLVSSLSLPPKIAKVKNTVARVVRPKNVRRVRKLLINDANSIRVADDYVDITSGEFLYVNMTFYEVDFDNGKMNVANLVDYFHEYKDITGNELKLYALTPAIRMRKLPPNWVNFFDHFKSLMNKKISNLKFVDHTKIEEDHAKIDRNLVEIMNVIKITDIKNERLKSFFIDYNKSMAIKEKNDEKLKKVRMRFRHMIKDTIKNSTYTCVSDEAQKIMNEFPMFRIMITPHNSYWYVRNDIGTENYERIVKSTINSIT